MSMLKIIMLSYLFVINKVLVANKIIITNEISSIEDNDELIEKSIKSKSKKLFKFYKALIKLMVLVIVVYYLNAKDKYII